jgi:hypothetical protein
MNNKKILKTTGIEVFTNYGIYAFIKEFNYDEKTIKLFLRSIFPNPNTFYYHWAKKENNIKSRVSELKKINQHTQIK